MAETEAWHTRPPHAEAASWAAQSAQPARYAAQLAIAEQQRAAFSV